MRFFWRTDEEPLSDHARWIGKIDRKNQQPGTSAPTLANAWSGPLDLLNALATVPDLAGLTVRQLVVEKRASFDIYRGNVRNHDLVMSATTSTDEPVVVCVEAKAGEKLGDVVAQQRKRAQRAKEKARAQNKDSKATERLDELILRLCRGGATDTRVKDLRYQLLTGWAGTLADAKNSKHAIFAIHEFRTDQRPEDRSQHNRDELDRFADAVLGCVLPIRQPPWCMRVTDVDGVDAKLYLAHVVTDLRSAVLQGGRLPWLERAIPETETFCESIEQDAEMERSMTRFDMADYDFEIDLNHQAEMARRTLVLMQNERQSILARRTLRKGRQS
jgi:hypothetical protein